MLKECDRSRSIRKQFKTYSENAPKVFKSATILEGVDMYFRSRLRIRRKYLVEKKNMLEEYRVNVLG
jgi:hypothetical protein